MNKLAILLLGLFSFQFAYAQDIAENVQASNIDFSFGVADNANMLRLSFAHYWGVGAKKKFQVGAGLRLLTVFGDR